MNNIRFVSTLIFFVFKCIRALSIVFNGDYVEQAHLNHTTIETPFTLSNTSKDSSKSSLTHFLRIKIDEKNLYSGVSESMAWSLHIIFIASYWIQKFLCNLWLNLIELYRHVLYLHSLMVSSHAFLVASAPMKFGTRYTNSSILC